MARKPQVPGTRSASDEQPSQDEFEKARCGRSALRGQGAETERLDPPLEELYAETGDTRPRRPRAPKD